MKKCSKCDTEKPLSEFYKNSAAKDGLTSQCKQCIKSYQLEYSKDPKNKARAREYQKNYTRSEESRRRKNELSLKRYYKNKAAINARMREYMRDYIKTEKAKKTKSLYESREEVKLRRYVYKMQSKHYAARLLSAQLKVDFPIDAIPEKIVDFKRKSLELKRLIKQKKYD